MENFFSQCSFRLYFNSCKNFFTNGSSVLTILASLVVTAFSSLCLGCTATERKFLYDKLNKLRKKVKK